MSKNEDNYQITKNLSEKRLKELCGFFKSKNLQEFTLIEGDLEVSLKAQPETSEPKVTTLTPVSTASSSSQPVGNDASGESDTPTTQGTPIKAPISGNFYASPSPKDPPYVKVGSSIKKGNKLCIIEAMKVMNEIPSPLTGKITAILVENGKPVKQGETIMTIIK